MSWRSAWQKFKATAEKEIPKGFFGTENLGPLLDKVEEAEKKYEKLLEKKGTSKDEMTRAKKELDTAAQKAYVAAEVYRKAAEEYKKRPDMEPPAKQQALTMVWHFLGTQIVKPIKKMQAVPAGQPLG